MKRTIVSMIVAGAVALGAHLHAQDADVAEVKITADKIQLIYDVTEFTVKAGQKVKLTFAVPEGCPFLHNLIIVGPGQQQALAAAATTAMTSNPAYLSTGQCIPEFEGILHHTNLVAAGADEVLEFEAPTEPGEYPYVCTYPGHWITMVGTMTVE